MTLPTPCNLELKLLRADEACERCGHLANAHRHFAGRAVPRDVWLARELREARGQLQTAREYLAEMAGDGEVWSLPVMLDRLAKLENILKGETT